MNPTYSSVTGNSLKYARVSSSNSESNQFYKNMRLSTQDQPTSTPSHVLLSPTDNSKILNFINFNDLGESSLMASSAFKKIQSASKASHSTLFTDTGDMALKYNKIHDLYVTGGEVQEGRSYGINRQHNFTSKATTTNNFKSYLDDRSVAKALTYNSNQNLSTGMYVNPANVEGVTISHTVNTNNTSGILSPNLSADSLESSSIASVSRDFGKSSTQLQDRAILNVATPSTTLLDNSDSIPTPTSNMFSSSLLYRQGDVKSPNQSVLSGDRSVRNTGFMNPTTNSQSHKPASVPSLSLSNSASISSQLVSSDSLTNINSATTTFPDSHTPTSNYSNNMVDLTFDKFNANNTSASLLSAKEELAPNFVFQPFWLSLWASTGSDLRSKLLLDYSNSVDNLALPMITEYVEYDFNN